LPSVPAESRTLLSVEELVCRYEQALALDRVSLEVRASEIVSVIGPNGAGKSTLLRAISGLLRPTSGRVRFDGQEITGRPAEAIVRLGISHVPEGRRLFLGLSVADNLEMGAVAARRRQWREDAQRVFEMFPVLGERPHQMAWSLSGGQQQMLAVGRALMARPRLLLLDEPSLGLAPLLVQEVLRRVVEINREGTAILLAEQNARLALQISHRAIVLANGAVVLEEAASVLAADARVRALYLGGS
jgi:branched-chain amino acid transport system ATP-binding protein